MLPLAVASPHEKNRAKQKMKNCECKNWGECYADKCICKCHQLPEDEEDKLNFIKNNINYNIN